MLNGHDPSHPRLIGPSEWASFRSEGAAAPVGAANTTTTLLTVPDTHDRHGTRWNQEYARSRHESSALLTVSPSGYSAVLRSGGGVPDDYPLMCTVVELAATPCWYVKCAMCAEMLCSARMQR